MSEQDFRVPPSGPMPLPTPEHQRKITNNKWFEVSVVVLMIVGGAGYLLWRNSGSITPVDPARTLADSAKVVERAGGVKSGSTKIFDREMDSYSQKMGLFECHVELMGKGPESPLETAIIWLTPGPGDWAPTEKSLLEAVNSVGELGHKLVQSTAEAMDKASNTMELIQDVDRPHEKGVSATNDGWKVTYVTYRGFDEASDPPQAVLYYVIQRLSAGEDESLGLFNRTLYDAIHRGTDAKAAVQAVSKDLRISSP